MRHIFTGIFIGSHESIIISRSRSNFKVFFTQWNWIVLGNLSHFSLSLSFLFLLIWLKYNKIKARKSLQLCSTWNSQIETKQREKKNVWNSSLHQVTVCSIYSFNIFYCHFAEIDKQWDRQNTSQQEMCASFGDLGWDMIKM